MKQSKLIMKLTTKWSYKSILLLVTVTTIWLEIKRVTESLVLFLLRYSHKINPGHSQINMNCISVTTKFISNLYFCIFLSNATIQNLGKLPWH